MSRSLVLRTVFLIAGMALFAILIANADIAALWHQGQRVGFIGMGVVLLLFVANFWTDVASWRVLLEQLPFDPRWSARLYAIRMIGEAFNNVTPTASVGGEPVKAWLLKQRYGVRLRDGGVTLVLAKTTIFISLALFAGVAFVILMRHPTLAARHWQSAAWGLVMLCVFCGVFILMQRMQLSTRIARALGRFEWGRRLSGLVHLAEDFDAMFLRYHAEHHRRLSASLLFAFFSWVLGTVEFHYVSGLLGAPLSWGEAWMAEAFVQSVRTFTFFVPAALGTQEGAAVLICAAMVGQGGTGLALALVRRLRDIIWIVLGLLLAAQYAVSPARVRSEREFLEH